MNRTLIMWFGRRLVCVYSKLSRKRHSVLHRAGTDCRAEGCWGSIVSQKGAASRTAHICKPLARVKRGRAMRERERENGRVIHFGTHSSMTLGTKVVIRWCFRRLVGAAAAHRFSQRQGSSSLSFPFKTSCENETQLYV